jgi:hypothetical protein
MPAVLFIALLVIIIFEMSYLNNWWIVEKSILPWGEIGSPSLVLGIFTVGHLWILRLTFEKSFIYYMIANIITDAVYSFVVLTIFVKMGIYRLENMGEIGIFLLMVLLAVLGYLYQKWQDEVLIDAGE